MNVLKEHTEQELLETLSKGNAAESSEAFDVIYRKYVAEMYRFARKNLPRKEDCEEIVQDIFTSLWTRREHLAVESLRNFLLGAVRYNIIRYFKSKKVKQRYVQHFEIFEVLYDKLDDEALDVNHPSKIRIALEKCLTELPNRCQQVVRLRVFENLSNKEIAKNLNISKKTVENYMVMAYSHFRVTHEKSYRAGKFFMVVLL